MSSRTFREGLRSLNIRALAARIADTSGRIEHYRSLRSRDSKHWSDGDLLAFIRHCLRRKGSTVHDAIEPHLEEELDRLANVNEEQLRILLEELRGRHV